MSNRKVTREIIDQRRRRKMIQTYKKSPKKMRNPTYKSVKSIKNKLKTSCNTKKIPSFISIFNTQLCSYILDKSNHNYQIGIHDAGGGGDCLFHAISSGITQAVSLGLDTQSYKMRELRNLVGNYIQSLEKKKFDELLDTYKVMEKYSGDWNDKWSPSSISNQQQLANEFRKTGNNHWGNEVDLKSLSEKLKIGFIIFSNIIENIYCFGQDFSFKKPNYYILIYNISNIHYTLAGLKKKNESSYISVYRPSDIPVFLKEEYKKMCHCSL